MPPAPSAATISYGPRRRPGCRDIRATDYTGDTMRFSAEAFNVYCQQLQDADAAHRGVPRVPDLQPPRAPERRLPGDRAAAVLPENPAREPAASGGRPLRQEGRHRG